MSEMTRLQIETCRDLIKMDRGARPRIINKLCDLALLGLQQRAEMAYRAMLAAVPQADKTRSTP